MQTIYLNIHLEIVFFSYANVRFFSLVQSQEEKHDCQQTI